MLELEHFCVEYVAYECTRIVERLTKFVSERGVRVLSEQEVCGLREDKLKSIRSFIKFSSRMGAIALAAFSKPHS